MTRTQLLLVIFCLHLAILLELKYIENVGVLHTQSTITDDVSNFMSVVAKYSSRFACLFQIHKFSICKGQKQMVLINYSYFVGNVHALEKPRVSLVVFLLCVKSPDVPLHE